MAINFSQVRALQIQNEAYRQLEYINLKNSNYFNMGETTGGLCCDFDVKLNLATGVSYALFGFSNYNFYQTSQVGYSVNSVSVTHASVSFSFGRRASSSENYTYANLADKPAIRINGVRKVIRTFINSENKAGIKLFEPDGTLIESTVDSYRAYSTIPYARPTGLFSGYRYKDDTYKFANGIPSGTLYSYKVRATEDGPLVENWLPAQRKADGAIGIYDTVNKVFLQPVSTTSSSLEAGPVFNENPQWSPLVRVKQIKNANNVVLWTAAPELTSITLAGYNTSLNINSNFLYGGTVTANYSDGSTADVTLDTTFSGYDMSTAGTQTVTASYTEHGITKTATYQLTIVAENWVTLWEGTQTITRSSSGQSGSTSEFAQSQANTGSTPTLRITFEMTDITPSTDVYYVVNGTNTNTKPNSPISATFSNITPLAVRGGQYEVRMYMFNRSSSNNVYFMLYSAAYSSGATTSVTLTIKKIEQLIE